MKYQYKPFSWKDEVRTIEVRDYWGCYEKRSDKSLTVKADRFVKAMLDTERSSVKARKAGMKFVLAWRRMCRTKTHRKNGVGDTAVRECVWDFLNKIYNTFGYSEYTEIVWNEAEEIDYKKEKALREAK